MKHWLNVAALAVVAATSVPAAAQGWPAKAVTLVVPYPAGGNVDSAARIVGERLQAMFKQPFLVDNRPGAGGMIAGEYVARAAPDGYTFFMAANGPILFAPTIYRRAAYDWKKDFVPVSSVSFTPLVLQVNPQRPYTTVQQLIAAGKMPDNSLTMASPGAGTQNHLVSELLQRQSGAHWLTVHYKGNAPATTDVLGGQVDFNFDQVSVALPFIQKGSTRALAVTSAQRLPALPNVPTLEEAGFKDLTALTFTGMLAPKATSPEIVHRLSEALVKILAEPAIKEKFLQLGAQARGDTPEQFKDFLNQEDKRWIPIIQQANITSD